MTTSASWDATAAAWDAPSATWDTMPGPQPQKSKKKPFHRSPKPTPTNPPSSTNITMSTFKFNVIPNAAGGFRTQAVLGPQIVEADFTALVVTDAALTAPAVTAAQAESVIRSFFKNARTCAAGCSWSSGLYGEMSIRPTCGGSQPSPDAFQNAQEINADIAISFIAEVRDAWRSTLLLESQGTKGLVTPIIDAILSEEDGAQDHYVPGTMIRIVGHDLRFVKTDITQGVFFIKPDGSEVRATVYGPLDPSQITVLVPATLSGVLQVRIAAFINGSVRTHLYTRSIS